MFLRCTLRKLNKILPIEMMLTIYQALYKSILQSVRTLEVQQKLIVQICLNKKKILIQSSTQHYIKLNVLPVRSLNICTNNLPYYLYQSNKIESKHVNTHEIRT